MSEFVELTLEGSQKTYIRKSAITVILKNDALTGFGISSVANTIVMVGKDSNYVSETPEEILKMLDENT